MSESFEANELHEMHGTDEMSQLDDLDDDESLERELFAVRVEVAPSFAPSFALDVEDVFRRVEVQRARLAADEAVVRSRPLRVAWAVAAAALFATYLGLGLGSSASIMRDGEGDQGSTSRASEGDVSSLVCRDDECVTRPCMSVQAANASLATTSTKSDDCVSWSSSRAVPARRLDEIASLESVTFTPARP